MFVSRSGAGRGLATALVMALLPALGGCWNHGAETTGSLYPNDVRDRHPIVLKDAPRVLDLFVEGTSGLSYRSQQDLAGFAAEYGRYGSGPMLVQVPAGAGTNPHTRRALEIVRGELGGRVSVSTYHPSDPTVASPIRLTFKRLQAQVGDKCGLWPDDLGVSDPERSWRNEEYWNLGCAQRSNFAAQVADPSDLLRGRRETHPDTGRRMYNIQQVRQGNDPSTAWKAEAASVSGGIQ